MSIKILKDGNNITNTNSYLIYNEENKIAYIIDAPSKTQSFVETIDELGLQLRYVILTHGHYDHILEMDFWRDKYGAKVVANKLSKTYLEDPVYNLTVDQPDKISNYADIYLEDDKGQFEIFKYINTPGHSYDSTTYILGNLLISGDLIFKESIGRTDFIGSNYEDSVKSIRNIIYSFDDDFIILPGHGPNTTVGHEKEYNPFVPFK